MIEGKMLRSSSQMFKGISHDEMQFHAASAVNWDHGFCYKPPTVC